MKKLIGILLALALALVLVLPALAEGDPSALEWGMTQEQVIAILGEPDSTSEISTTGITELDYANRKYGDTEYTGILCVGIRADGLCLRMYLLDDADMSAYNALKESMTEEYGKDDGRSELVLETMAFMAGVDVSTLDEETLATVRANVAQLPHLTWKTPDNTDVIMLYADARTGIMWFAPEEE